QLREGWTKNLVLLFRSPVRLAVLRLTEFVLIAGGATITIAACAHEKWIPVAISGVLTVVPGLFFVKRIRKAHFSWDANCLAVFGLPLFSYLLLRSRKAYRMGTISWKGRRYAQNTSRGVGDAATGRPHDSQRDAGATRFTASRSHAWFI